MNAPTPTPNNNRNTGSKARLRRNAYKISSLAWALGITPKSPTNEPQTFEQFFLTDLANRDNRRGLTQREEDTLNQIFEAVTASEVQS
jgi:hypothetical protein